MDSNVSIEFLDSVKHAHNCKISSCSKISSDFYCFWCRLFYKTKPYPCPIKYFPKQIVKQYQNHSLKGNVEEACNSENATIFHSYFEVDGVFCSWSCVIAYVRDNAHNVLYANSEQLVYQMRNDYSVIVPSPHWRTLTVHGGWLSEDEMRKAIGNFSYEYHHHIVFLNHMYEKKLVSK